MRISDWSSDVCSSDLSVGGLLFIPVRALRAAEYLHSLRQLSLWLGCTRAWPDDGRHRRLQHHRAGRAGATDSRTAWRAPHAVDRRSEEHTSELQSLMRISYAVFCLKKKNTYQNKYHILHARTKITRHNNDTHTKSSLQARTTA